MKRHRLTALIASIGLLAAAPVTLPASARAVVNGTPMVGAGGILRTTSQLETTPRPGLRISSAPIRLGPSAKADDGPSPAAARPSAAASSGSSPKSAISGVTSFDGPTLESSVFPPDTQGDVGPTQFIVMLNTRVQSYDKLTGQPDGGIDIGSDSFWAPELTPVGIGGCNFASDPHIRFDRLSGSWIAIMIDVPNCDATQSNRIMIAVSDGDTIGPSTVWTFFHIAVTSGEFADYPTLGVDANALYIGTNEFATSNGNFVNTNGYVVRKSSILGAGPIVFTPFTHLIGSDGPFTPQGVDDPNPGIGVGYFIGVDNNSFGQLDLLRVTDPGGTPSISSVITLNVPLTSFPIRVPHLGNTGGTTGRLDALDDRLFAATMTSDRHIWTAHNIQVDSVGNASSSGGRDGSRWYEINPGSGTTPVLVQSGTVFDPAASNPNSYWIPTVAVSGQRIMVIAGSTAGAAAHADAWYAARTTSDAAGSVSAPVTYTSSSFAYNPPGDNGSGFARRWGDYSLTRVDPQDNQTLWTIQEYAQADDTWGVRIARLQALGPATPTSTSHPVRLGRSSAHVTLTGTSTADSGWFDPGPAFPDRLEVSVGCGVTVNGVGFVSPTALDLDLDTTGATAGPCSVTTTNPDGQTASATVLTTAKDRPDGKIKRAGDPSYLGNDVYNLMGSEQTAIGKRRAGTNVAFSIREQNDGNVSDRMVLEGPGNRPGFTVRYFFGHTDITQQVIDGTYRTQRLIPGGVQTFRLRIHVAPGTSIDTVRSWLVTASSVHDPTKRDAVRAKVRVISG
jgi:hypothetical protein